MAAAAAEKEAIDDMKREKSCGALVVRKNGENFDLVLLRHRFGGHWSFPKGHVEAGESERQTALREVREETGLAIRLLDGFRESVEYFPKPGVKKQVVYFLGEALGDELVPQEEEISELIWTPLLEAAGLVTFANDKRLIRLAKRRLGLPEPDMVIYLDLPAEVSEELLRRREAETGAKADIHERDALYLRQCRESARDIARSLGWRILHCADGLALHTPEAIHSQVWELVQPLLGREKA